MNRQPLLFLVSFLSVPKFDADKTDLLRKVTDKNGFFFLAYFLFRTECIIITVDCNLVLKCI
jgi:hypothetical protein